jgi:hypothetical protein
VCPTHPITERQILFHHNNAQPRPCDCGGDSCQGQCLGIRQRQRHESAARGSGSFIPDQQHDALGADESSVHVEFKSIPDQQDGSLDAGEEPVDLNSNPNQQHGGLVAGEGCAEIKSNPNPQDGADSDFSSIYSEPDSDDVSMGGSDSEDSLDAGGVASNHDRVLGEGSARLPPAAHQHVPLPVPFPGDAYAQSEWEEEDHSHLFFLPDDQPSLEEDDLEDPEVPDSENVDDLYNAKVSEDMSVLCLVVLIFCWQARYKVNNTATKGVFRLLSLVAQVKLPTFDQSRKKFQSTHMSTLDNCNCAWVYGPRDTDHTTTCPMCGESRFTTKVFSTATQPPAFFLCFFFFFYTFWFVRWCW